MNKSVLLSLFIIIFNGLAVLSQDAKSDDSVLKKSPLSGQFDYVITKSSTYEDFKVVKSYYINLLKNNSVDSIFALKANINSINNEIKVFQKQQDSLVAQINLLKGELKIAIQSKNSMSFFGFSMQKPFYDTIVWSAIIILLVLSSGMLLIYKRNLFVTRNAKNRVGEIEEEFENYRKITLKREQKLARELLDFKLKHNLDV